MSTRLLAALVLLGVTSCGTTPYRDEAVSTSSEFVADAAQFTDAMRAELPGRVEVMFLVEPDGRITLGHEECLGACAYAPMMRVDDTYHEDLDFEKAKRILDGLE